MQGLKEAIVEFKGTGTEWEGTSRRMRCLFCFLTRNQKEPG